MKINLFLGIFEEFYQINLNVLYPSKSLFYLVLEAFDKFQIHVFDVPYNAFLV